MSLLLLHGALGAADHFDSLLPALEGYDVHRLNFSGHGGQSRAKEFGIAQFGADVLQYLSENNLKSVDIFGYSMGGYVGAWLAFHHPQKVNRLMTLGTKWSWSPEISAKEIRMLNPVKIEEKVPAFASALAKRHAPLDWKNVMQDTADMMIAMGDQPPVPLEMMAEIQHKTLICWGDQDKMVSQEESKYPAIDPNTTPNRANSQ